MTNPITNEVLSQYDAKIKKRMEHKPEGSLKEWLTEINALIFECNQLAGYERYKIQKDDKSRDNS